MTIRLGVVMDAVDAINYHKDSTLAMLWEAEKRGWEIYYFQQSDLYLLNCVPYGHAKIMHVHHDETWYSWHGEQTMQLSELDVILMRKDPPFDTQYFYTTYLLEHAEKAGVLVVNRPRSLRDCNEKLFACDFPECVPPSIVTQSRRELDKFWREHKDIVVKPLDAMGGAAVFRLEENSVNANVIFEILTQDGTTQVMAQRYIPEIVAGDKRLLIIDGEPVPYMLARIPQPGDWRGNLAAGAKGRIVEMTGRDKFIADKVASELRERGLYFVGLDIIGDYLTEINITSPTGIREIEAGSDFKVTERLFDCIEAKLRKHTPA